jgi:hypothetical protein
MVTLSPYETMSAWLFLHLLLIAIPAVAGFVVGRRGRLHLWHVAALVLLTALLLLPAVADRGGLFSRSEAWLSVMLRMLMHAHGWPTVLVALSLGFGLGVVLLRSGRRGRLPKRRPFATPADA